MTDEKTTEAEQESLPWVWMQYVPASLLDDEPVLRAQINLMAYQAGQAATHARLRLLPEPNVNTSLGVLLPGHGEEGDEDYQAAYIVDAALAETMDLDLDADGVVRLALLRVVWKTEALPEPTDDEG